VDHQCSVHFVKFPVGAFKFESHENIIVHIYNCLLHI